MTEIEVLHTARIVIAQQGDEAARHYARERHRLSAQRDDVEGAQTWERIACAIHRILDTGAEGTLH